MKTKAKVLTGFLFLFMFGRAAHAAECSTKDLYGLYSMTFQGEILGVLTGSPPTLTPFTTPTIVKGVQVIWLDGQGGFKNLAFAMRNGAPVGTGQLTQDGFQDQTGNYHVNPDCTGSGTISQPGQNVKFALVVGNDGKRFRYLVTGLHAAALPGNENCTSGCDLAPEIVVEGEKVFDKEKSR